MNTTAEEQERRHFRARRRVHELRQKRQEEDGHFRIQHIRQHARAIDGPRAFDRQLGDSGRRRSIEQHPDAEVGEIRRARELDDQEGVGGRGENRRQPERRRDGVHDAPRGDAEHRKHAGAAPLREAAADDVEGVLPGRQVQQEAAEDEQREILGSEHVQLRGRKQP